MIAAVVSFGAPMYGAHTASAGRVKLEVSFTLRQLELLQAPIFESRKSWMSACDMA